MTPAHIKAICQELVLSPKDLAGVLSVPDTDAIRLWSTGGVPIPPPIIQRIRHLVSDWRRANRVAQAVIEAKIKPMSEAWRDQQGERPRAVGLTVYDPRSIARLKAEEPSVTLSMHNLVNRATAMKLAEMGIPVRLTVIAEDDYRAWLGARADSKASRALYARDAAKSHELGLPLSASPLGQAVLRMKDIPETIAVLGLDD